ncbi:MAG: SPASM domain-containing protein [Clostridiales bacterium]|nr:SPASM domain-containing protein [Clostridiales bacterium]
MIGLSSEEIQEYKSWMKNTFDITACDIESWRNDDLFKIDNIKTGQHSYAIEHKSHTQEGQCQSPFYHMHIAWNGNVLYCTDFYDFCAGNVKEDTLKNIFLNEKSERYRKEILNGRCVSCNHCSWKNTSFTEE